MLSAKGALTALHERGTAIESFLCTPGVARSTTHLAYEKLVNLSAVALWRRLHSAVSAGRSARHRGRLLSTSAKRSSTLCRLALDYDTPRRSALRSPGVFGTRPSVRDRAYTVLRHVCTRRTPALHPLGIDVSASESAVGCWRAVSSFNGETVGPRREHCCQSANAAPRTQRQRAHAPWTTSQQRERTRLRTVICFASAACGSGPVVLSLRRRTPGPRAFRACSHARVAWASSRHGHTMLGEARPACCGTALKRGRARQSGQARKLAVAPAGRAPDGG